jgi:hypothetical protein
MIENYQQFEDYINDNEIFQLKYKITWVELTEYYVVFHF